MFSKIASGVVWTALTVVILFLLFDNGSTHAPPADKATPDTKSFAITISGKAYEFEAPGSGTRDSRTVYADRDYWVNSAVPRVDQYPRPTQSALTRH